MAVNKQQYPLNLPKTSFPMKANLAHREPKFLEKWQANDIYGKILGSKDENNKFILQDGPPFANGDIHIGHCLNKILKDIILKSKSMQGKYAPFIPGWDCHGLPIEVIVEKKVGKVGHKIDADSFRQKCREYAAKQVDIQRNSFKRLGVLANWDSPYITMDYKYEADIVRTLGKIIENGHIASGDRPVHWCVDCGSSLAEAEVEYIEKESFAIDVAFSAANNEAVCRTFNSPVKDVDFVIWTTTPWTLPANQAIALHADLEYSLVSFNNRYLILASALIDSLKEKYKSQENDFNIVGTCKGQELEGMQANHPFYDRVVPIILGDHVTTDAGTGCVHTAPAHGNEDYIVGLKYNLKIENPVDPRGCFYEDTPIFGKQFVFKANESVIETLQTNNKLLHQAKIQHQYPHCWRHKRPLIFRATKQWFISMEKSNLRQNAIDAIPGVKWIPEFGEARIKSMIEGRPDWCVSRQRTWGTPLALVLHKREGTIHPDMPSIIKKIATAIEKEGMQAWFDMELSELIPAEQLDDYEKNKDTLDVWFDSGSVNYCVGEMREELYSPADLYLEGSDQHRGWFQSSLLTSLAAMGKIPYKQVLTHGFTVDQDGRKMSKSLKNVVSPDAITKTLGADVLRLWVAATDYKYDLHVSDEILKRTSDVYRRIRNTARFLLANLNGFEPKANMVPGDKLLNLDAWIVNYVKDLQEKIINYYNEYQFHNIYQEIQVFCSDTLGSFYLDIIKDRQYTLQENSLARRSCQTALYHVAMALTKWIAPILSFTAEEIYDHIPGDKSESVFLDEFYSEFPECSSTADWETIMDVRSFVNKSLEDLRSKDVIGAGLEAKVTIFCNEKYLDILTKIGDELRFVFITSTAEVEPYINKHSDAIDIVEKELALHIVKSQEKKCDRCWHRVDSVGQNKDHPTLCHRCITNVFEKGETRIHA